MINSRAPTSNVVPGDTACTYLLMTFLNIFCQFFTIKSNKRSECILGSVYKIYRDLLFYLVIMLCLQLLECESFTNKIIKSE